MTRRLAAPVGLAGTWQHRAACRGMDPAWWDVSAAIVDVNVLALRVCRGGGDTPRCPVIGECLSAALDARDWGVIRGGVEMPAPMQWHRCGKCRKRFLRRSDTQTGRRRSNCRTCAPQTSYVPRHLDDE